MKKPLVIILAILDVILLGVIIISVATGWRIGAPKTKPKTPDKISQTVESSVETRNDVSKTEEPERGQTEDAEVSQTQKPAETSKPAYPAAQDISTDDYPTLGDIQGFKWSKDDGAYWSILTSDAVKLTDFEAVKGGWKAYMLDDPSHKVSDQSAERLLNINISGSETVAKATVDWLYVTAGDEGDGHDDNSPDSVFNGEWSGGEFGGLGAGKLTLDGFYFEKGREYATGVYIWPDGVEAIVALVRP